MSAAPDPGLLQIGHRAFLTRALGVGSLLVCPSSAVRSLPFMRPSPLWRSCSDPGGYEAGERRRLLRLGVQLRFKRRVRRRARKVRKASRQLVATSWSMSRVTDAIDRAGGTTRAAAPDAINLAAPLADGQQIQVPAKVESGGGAATGSASTDGPISLGTATVEELDTIEGIGPVTAAAILEFRDQNGGISSVDDLDQVSGIGPTTMEALRTRLQP
jgi:comEA protein